MQCSAGVRKCLNALPAYLDMSLFTKFSVAVLFAPLGVPTEDLDIRWFYFRYVSVIWCWIFFVVEFKDYDFDLVQNLPLLIVSTLKNSLSIQKLRFNSYADTFQAVRV